ncbi:MAG: DUF99 family protein [Candidatus Bathyarchaeota archaeon]|nr:DUF99 family protein [Candidatus Bathyarchaeota archaeon]
MRPVLTVAVGVQDGSFEAFQRGIANAIQHTSLCITKLAGAVIQDIRIGCITVDGLDATDVLLNNLKDWDYDVLILGGATFAGFNVVDVEYVYKVTGKPVIVYSPRMPDMEATLHALRKHFSDWEMRWSRYEALGELHECKIKDYPPLYYEVVGESTSYAEKVLREQAINGRMPEAVRVADLIAKGVTPVFRGQVGSRYES